MEEEKAPQQAQKPKTWKDRLYSEKAMKYINFLLCITLIFGIPLGTVVAYALWLAYLICGIVVRRDDRTLRIIYAVMAVFASVVIVLNLINLF